MNNTTTTSNTKLTFKSALLTACRNSYWEDRNIKLIVNDKNGIEIMDVKMKSLRNTENKVEVSQKLYWDTVTFDVSLDDVIEYQYKGRSRKK